MMEGTLYNGKQFPDYIFNNNNSNYLFLEFDFVFTKEFWETFKVLLESNDIKEIAIENIEPSSYSFYNEVSVKHLPESFIESTCVERAQDYIDEDASFFMLTEQGLIYPIKRKEVFCIFLDRRYWLAILGYSKVDSLDFFKNVSIKDIISYLTVSFDNNEIPGSFKDTLHKNWRPSPNSLDV